MIDWITARFPLPHKKPINDGNRLDITSEGEVNWSVDKRLRVVGSHDSTISVRTVHLDHECSHIEIDGNLTKFFQGHNIWGTDDIHGLVSEALIRILKMVECPLVPFFDTNRDHRISLAARTGIISRLDINYMFDLGTPEKALAYIRACGANASISRVGKGVFAGETLYWGKNSRRWSLKMYHKGSEIKKHKLSLDNPVLLPEVTLFADKCVRVELVLRGLQLDKIKLDGDYRRFREVQSWREGDVASVYNSYLSKLNFSENMTVSFNDDSPKIRSLSPKLLGIYSLWKQGCDLRSMYPKNTYYRYRRELMDKIGLDIKIPSGNIPEDRTNVVPIRMVLEAKPLEIPNWAYGTDLYFQPRHFEARIK